MGNKVVYIFIRVLACLLLCCQNAEARSTISEKGLEYFYEALRRMDLENAQYRINSLDDGEKELATRLLKIYGGQKAKIGKEPGKLDIDQQILWHLNRGYLENNVETENTVAAFQHFSRAIDLASNGGRKNALKFSLISMMNLLRKQSFFGNEKFLPYLEHYEDIATDIHDERIILLQTVGLKSKEASDLSSDFQGYQTIEKLDDLFSNVGKNDLLKAKYFFETGVQYKLAKDYENAMVRMEQAREIAENQPINIDILEASTWHISSLYRLKGQLDSALAVWKKSAKLSKSLRNKWYHERLASWIYRDLGKNDSAYFYLNESVNTEFLMDGKQQRLQSSLLSVENQTEKLKLDKLRLDNRRKTNQNYLIAAIAVLIIGWVTAFLRHKNNTKKRLLAEQEALLEQQKVETLLKEQELVSIDAMIAGQEKERTKVANELHDDLGSLMATVKLHFDNVKVDKKDPALKNAQALLEKAYQKIRGMAHAKNSGVMANQGLLPAVQKMARTINETNALKITVEDFGLADRMENSLELTIFRILQELVANVIKHAKATKVNIQFTQHKENLNIIVEDDGDGFDMSAVKRSTSGMGLGTIEKRIEHLEGSFTVDSFPGKGTSILIDIPV